MHIHMSKSEVPSRAGAPELPTDGSDGVVTAIERGLSNGRLEGLNNKIRLLSHPAYGFHSAHALLAVVYLCGSGIELEIPADQRPGMDPFMLAFEHARR